MFLFRCFHCHRRPTDISHQQRGPPRVTDEPPSLADKPPTVVKRFQWHEVEKLTGNLTAEVVGQGGFSTVYLAQLTKFGGGGSETTAAIKIQRSSERLYRVFLQELDVLLHVTHPNIVKLLGYSDDHEEGVLIFEYVPNGTLHDKLHSNGGLTAPSSTLPWSRRMFILLQIASAVDYLHDGCDLQIVHGDITASNVLLDDRLNPKLCDFGFARKGFSAAVKPAAAGHMFGSPGYADPHYLRTGIISKKSDVYSFGVLIFELISGIPAVRSEDEKMLTALMRDVGNERMGEMVDPRLGGNFDAGELRVMGELASKCVGERLGLRPSMADIVRIMREEVASSISTVG